MRYKMRCRFAAIEIMGGYLRDSVKQQIGICRAVCPVVCGIDAEHGKGSPV